jgi:hypothetical protein
VPTSALVDNGEPRQRSPAPLRKLVVAFAIPGDVGPILIHRGLARPYVCARMSCHHGRAGVEVRERRFGSLWIQAEKSPRRPRLSSLCTPKQWVDCSTDTYEAPGQGWFLLKPPATLALGVNRSGTPTSTNT